MKRRFAYTQTIKTNGSGGATVYFGSKIHGRVVAFKFTLGTILGTGNLTMTTEDNGMVIVVTTTAAGLNGWHYPASVANKNTDGSAFTDVSGGSAVILGERIKLTIAQGGAVRSGSMTIYTEEEQ